MGIQADKRREWFNNRTDYELKEVEEWMKERHKYKKALEEIKSRGPHEHFEFYHLVCEALKK